MTPAEIKYRLEEIAKTNLQNLSDDVVLALLAERKELLALEAQLEAQKQQEAEQEKEFAQKKEVLLTRLQEINQGITADQDDEKLLTLITERKSVEEQLTALGSTASEAVAAPDALVELESVVNSEPEVPMEVHEETLLSPEEIVTAPAQETVMSEEQEQPVTENKIAIQQDASYRETSFVSDTGRVSELGSAGEERIVLDVSLQNEEYHSYLEELKANLNSLGTFLQSLPVEVKRNRAFMLEVAKFDPAYAMHYADKDTLKKDESFNVSIAGMNNQRNTGNALSEMLPEMRTGAVVLMGVKNDFRNVRFIRPEMTEYDDIMALAKKGALEEIHRLKGAHDAKDLVPAILQKDKAFMEQVQKMMSQE